MAFISITQHRIAFLMSTPFDDKEYLDRKECAKYLACLGYPISPSRLAHIACDDGANRGPPYHRVRWNKVYYKRAEVQSWLRSITERVG
jgi:hypothetical protein